MTVVLVFIGSVAKAHSAIVFKLQPPFFTVGVPVSPAGTPGFTLRRGLRCRRRNK